MPSGDHLLRVFVNTWTFIVLPFVILNFALSGQLDFLVVPTAVLYTGLLALYVGTKEFDRWYKVHRGRHPGEWFVITWTVVMIGLFGASIFLGPEHTIHSDLVAIYVAVLSLYAFTKKSKEMHKRNAANERAEDLAEKRSEKKPAVVRASRSAKLKTDK